VTWTIRWINNAEIVRQVGLVLFFFFSSIFIVFQALQMTGQACRHVEGMCVCRYKTLLNLLQEDVIGCVLQWSQLLDWHVPHSACELAERCTFVVYFRNRSEDDTNNYGKEARRPCQNLAVCVSYGNSGILPKPQKWSHNSSNSRDLYVCIELAISRATVFKYFYRKLI
jgi:hypothetical protein